MEQLWNSTYSGGWTLPAREKPLLQSQLLWLKYLAELCCLDPWCWQTVRSDGLHWGSGPPPAEFAWSWQTLPSTAPFQPRVIGTKQPQGICWGLLISNMWIVFFLMSQFPHQGDFYYYYYYYLKIITSRFPQSTLKLVSVHLSTVPRCWILSSVPCE